MTPIKVRRSENLHPIVRDRYSVRLNHTLLIRNKEQIFLSRKKTKTNCLHKLGNNFLFLNIESRLSLKFISIDYNWNPLSKHFSFIYNNYLRTEKKRKMLNWKWKLGMWEKVFVFFLAWLISLVNTTIVRGERFERKESEVRWKKKKKNFPSPKLREYKAPKGRYRWQTMLQQPQEVRRRAHGVGFLVKSLN